MRVIGLDPGLRLTGWGVIEAEGNRLSHVAHGVLRTDEKMDLAERLCALKAALEAVIAEQRPDAAAVEETLANRNPASTLKLGMARGVALLVPALAGLPVSQYLPMIVKKSVVGTGHAEKSQVAAMIGVLLPGSGQASADAADALAVAICHVHHSASRTAWGAGRSNLAAKPAAARGA